MQPPDERRAAPAEARDVDPPQRPLAVQALPEQARDLGAQRGRVELGSAGRFGDVPGGIEIRLRHPRRTTARCAEPHRQRRNRGDPLGNAGAQLLERRRR